MRRILLVLFGFSLIWLCESVESPTHYYLASSYAYSTLSFLGVWLFISQKSILILLYSTGNLFAAVLNFCMIDPLMFNLLDNFYWGGFLNYCLILNALDLMLICTGAVSVYNFITAMSNSNNHNILHHYYIVGRSN